MANNIPIDTDYYLYNQLLPPVMRILECFDVSSDSLIYTHRQTVLPTNKLI